MKNNWAIFPYYKTQILSASVQLHTSLTHNCTIMIYIHTLMSLTSSSENLHKLLSSVILLVHVPIPESASMSCTVSCAARNTGTLSSATGSEMEVNVKGLFSC